MLAIAQREVQKTDGLLVTDVHKPIAWLDNVFADRSAIHMRTQFRPYINHLGNVLRYDQVKLSRENCIQKQLEREERRRMRERNDDDDGSTNEAITQKNLPKAATMSRIDDDSHDLDRPLMSLISDNNTVQRAGNGGKLNDQEEEEKTDLEQIHSKDQLALRDAESAAQLQSSNVADKRRRRTQKRLEKQPRQRKEQTRLPNASVITRSRSQTRATTTPRVASVSGKKSMSSFSVASHTVKRASLDGDDNGQTRSTSVTRTRSTIMSRVNAAKDVVSNELHVEASSPSNAGSSDIHENGDEEENDDDDDDDEHSAHSSDDDGADSQEIRSTSKGKRQLLSRGGESRSKKSKTAVATTRAAFVGHHQVAAMNDLATLFKHLVSGGSFDSNRFATLADEMRASTESTVRGLGDLLAKLPIDPPKLRRRLLVVFAASTHCRDAPDRRSVATLPSLHETETLNAVTLGDALHSIEQFDSVASTARDDCWLAKYKLGVYLYKRAFKNRDLKPLLDEVNKTLRKPVELRTLQFYRHAAALYSACQPLHAATLAGVMASPATPLKVHKAVFNDALPVLQYMFEHCLLWHTSVNAEDIVGTVPDQRMTKLVAWVRGSGEHVTPQVSSVRSDTSATPSPPSGGTIFDDDESLF